LKMRFQCAVHKTRLAPIGVDPSSGWRCCRWVISQEEQDGAMYAVARVVERLRPGGEIEKGCAQTRRAEIPALALHAIRAAGGEAVRGNRFKLAVWRGVHSCQRRPAAAGCRRERNSPARI